MSRGIPTVPDPVWDRIPDDALDDYSKIDSSLSYAELKNDSPWGFVVYRCSYHDNSQWQRMVQLITSSVEESLTLNRRIDLLSRHRLTIMDDATQFDGATSHMVRDNVQSWVSSQLSAVLEDSEQRKSPVNGGESSIDVEMTLGTRYNFCLFVDNIALESLDRMSLPVIKLLCRFSGIRGPDERNYVVHPDYEDGETAEEHEDVGWMYTCVVDYCDIYTRLVESSDWYEEYCRPPWLKLCDEDEFPGFWRKKGSKAKA
ncbi:hypothetical protein ATEIFO6365_0007002900 [Aspergillus terreus]|uniref:Uncharacterized protein n=1 Tax=Aspergillus terreus TaxID=33178 RepID=A0A5M3Z803_ASPTE|nr:hypothetical protein ATETN484_0009002900 [Aspergillus terreus]GFF17480.1 hypothetical protein ATEIFO6365_0007002900 [Aspergillus terreus]